MCQIIQSCWKKTWNTKKMFPSCQIKTLSVEPVDVTGLCSCYSVNMLLVRVDLSCQKMIYANDGINGQQNSIFINVSQMFEGDVLQRHERIHLSKDDLARTAGGEISEQTLLMRSCVPRNLLYTPTVPERRSEVEYSHHLVVWRHFYWHDSTWILIFSACLSHKKWYLLEVKQINFTYSKKEKKRMFVEKKRNGLQAIKKMEAATERDQRRSAAETGWAWGRAASMRDWQWEALICCALHPLFSHSSFPPALRRWRTSSQSC